jgi:opacity protein-like surface antigen
MRKILFAAATLIPVFAFASPGPYATVQAGINTVNANNAFETPTLGFVGGAAAGYLWGNNIINYGLETDALVYPNSNMSKDIGAGHDLRIQYDGYNLSALGILKYTCHTGFTAFIKGGIAYVNQQVSSAIGGPGFTLNAENIFAPEAAIGMGYMVNPTLEVDISFDRVFADKQSTADAIVQNIKVVENDNYLVGLTYHFA